VESGEARTASDRSNATRFAAGEWPWALALAAVVALATTVPYLIAWAQTPPDHVWIGTTHNGTDTSVHFSWIVQARDGSFFLSNLFATEPQSGRFVHLWAWAIGALSALLHLPYVWVYHASRVAFTITSVVLVYRLAAHVTDEPLGRRWATATVVVGGGLGWLLGLAGAPFATADLVQPEVVTFLALYSSGLFAFSITLFLLVLTGLLSAERTGRDRDAVIAGAAAFLLINVHPYDAIPLAAAWTAYLLVLGIGTRSLPRRAFRASGIAAAIAAPAALWMLWYLLVDPVFMLRAAVATPALSPGHYLLGFGLLLPLAALGARYEPARRPMIALLVGWAVLQLGLGYLPTSVQRKLLMGIHVPIALLAGLGLARIHASRRGWAAAAALIVIVSLGNVFFVARDLSVLAERGGDLSDFRTYVPRDVVDGLAAAARTPRDAVIATSPEYSPHVAMVAGRTTVPGHWGETPRYHEKRAIVEDVLEGRTDLAAFAAATGATHLLVRDRLIPLR
jgi:hypothetical protein